MSDIIPPRVDKFLDYITSKIIIDEPKETRRARLREELKALSFHDKILTYCDWSARFLPPKKRKVYFGNSFNEIKETENFENFTLFKALVNKIQNGENLNKHLGIFLIKGWYPPSSNRFKDKDFWLNARGVYHLHLDEKKGDKVVMTLIDDEKIIILMVCGHDVFFNGTVTNEAIELEKRIANYYYSKGDILKHLKKGNETTDDKGHTDNLKLSKVGILSAPYINGEQILYPDFFSSGHSLSAYKQSQKFIECLIKFDPRLDDANFVNKLYQDNGLIKPDNPIFEWLPIYGGKLNEKYDIYHDSLGLFETTNRDKFLFVLPSRGLNISEL